MTKLTLPLAVVITLIAALIHAAPSASAADAFVVTGKVVDEKGNPVQDATVTGFSYSSDTVESNDKTQTAEDGSFTLRIGGGKANLQVWYEAWRAGDSRDLEIVADTAGLVFTLTAPPPRDALVEGVITDGQGNPVENAEVTIGQGCCYRLDKMAPTAPPGDAVSSESRMASPMYYDGEYQSATTGPDGKYAFKTYAGPRQISAHAQGYAQSTMTVEAVAGQTVDASMKLQKVPDANAIIQGRIIDASTGLPLANAGVSLGNLEWGRYDYATTDATGAYSFKTIPGWVQISVYYNGAPYPVAYASDGTTDITVPANNVPQKQYYAHQQAFTLAAGERTLDIQLESKSDPTIVLIGYVIDPNTQTGVEGANVNVWNQDTGDWGSATTDATGSYKILVKAGHYQLNAWADKHYQGTATFVIAEGETTKRVDVETPAGESKYAPCYDDGCGGRAVPMTSEISYTTGGTSPASVSKTSSADQAATTTSTGSASNGAESTRAASYQGSGGNLPPYDAKNAGNADVAGAAPASNVPALGIAVVLGLIGLAAIGVRRK